MKNDKSGLLESNKGVLMESKTASRRREVGQEGRRVRCILGREYVEGGKGMKDNYEGRILANRGSSRYEVRR